MNETLEQYRERCLNIHRDKGDFVTDVDGFVKYWPEGQEGFMEAYHLRWIADELDKLNEPWKQSIEDYFNSAPEESIEIDI